MDMTQRLQLVVAATDNGTEATFRRLGGAARDTGDAATRSASDVATAANRVAQAQLKQEDAAGQLRVALQRLHDLQAKGNATASQLAAAEERVAAAQRRVHLAARDADQATEGLTRAQRESVKAGEDAGEASGGMADGVENLRGKIVGLMAGVSLADYLRNTVQGFLDGARGANALASSMNASVEQAGQLYQLMANVGLETDDLLEIQAEFAGKTKDGLTLIGTELKKNSDGTVNWAGTLTDTLTELQKIPDATERNRQGFAMFGEEGYKQLSRLLNSGVDVADALEQIGTPFTDEDVRATQDYDQAMMRLNGTVSGTGRTLAREFVPLLTDALDAFGKIVSVVTAIPAPLAGATAAAILFGRTGLGPLAGFGQSITTAMGSARTAMDNYRVAQGIAGREGPAMMGLVSTAAGGASRAVGGLVSALGGPLGAGLIVMGAAVSLAQSQQEDFTEAVEDGAEELAAAEEQYGDMAASAEELGRRLADERSAWDNLAAAREGAKGRAEESDGFWGFLDDMPGFQNSQANMNSLFGDGELAAEGYAAGIDAAKAKLGEFETQQQVAQTTQMSLTELIAEGDTTSSDFAAAVQAAAEAQRNQTATSDTATAALAAYDAVTRGAVEAVRGLLDAQLAAQDSDYAYLDSLDALKAAQDDAKTSVDEVAQAHTAFKAAALDAAGAAADAAVAAATAAGTVITPLDEANIRADALITNLRDKLNTPGLSAGAKVDLEALVGQLETAKANSDVQALITLTGAGEVKGELDETTEDRDTTVTVESRNGPAVISYLDGIAKAERLALIRTESRGGPAVISYLDGIASRGRLALIQVESRGGPAVDSYLDSLASNFGAGRTAVINVQYRQTGAPPPQPTGAAGFAAPRGGPVYGAGGDVIIQQQTVQVVTDAAGRVTSQSLAAAGRQVVAQVKAYERQNGTGWRS